MLAKRKRRWLSFRLSTLLLGLTVLSIWLAVKYHRTPLSTDNLAQLQMRSSIPADIYRVVWSPDGKSVAFVQWEKPVEIRDAVTLWHLKTIGKDKKLIDFAFSPNKNTVAYCENVTTAEILDLNTGQARILDAVNHQPDVVFSPDGKILATGGYGVTARLWDVESGELLRELDVRPGKGGLTPAFSPDGRIVAIGHRNSKTHLFDVATGNRLHILPKTMSQELAFHPSRPVLAVAYVDASIVLWDVETGELLHSVKTTADEIFTLDWSPNGEILASAGLHGDIDLWSSSDLSLLHTLKGPEWVISVRFRPDNRGLFVAGGAEAIGGKRFVQEWEVPLFSK